MASFNIAYEKYIKPNEGGYSNVAQDKGGETYAGIARNIHPSWEGWPLVDQKKSRYGGTIPRNTMFSDLQFLVDRFYQTMWDKARIGGITSQEVANLLFDYYVNSGTIAIKSIQRLVGVTADGVIGPITLNAINSTDAAKLHDSLKAQRGQFYESIIARDPSQEVFRKGWFARLARFPDLTTGGIAMILFVLAVCGAIWWGTSQVQEKKSVVFNKTL